MAADERNVTHSMSDTPSGVTITEALKELSEAATEYAEAIKWYRGDQEKCANAAARLYEEIAVIRDALRFFTESNVRHYSVSCAGKRQDALVALGRIETAMRRAISEAPAVDRNGVIEECAKIALKTDYRIAGEIRALKTGATP